MRSFAECWSRAVQAGRRRPFLRFEDPTGRVCTWSYAEFDGMTQEVGSGLAGHGVGAGDRVHVALENSPAIVAIWLACVRLGAVFVPSDPRSTARELSVHVARVRPTVGVCAEERADVYPRDVPTIITVDEADPELQRLRAPGALPAIRPDSAQPAAILFTSGTTAAPKGVVVTQANYEFAGAVMAAASGLTHADRCFVVLPFFHANAQYYSFAPAIATGASVALISHFSASQFVSQAARHRASHLSLFAAPIRMILAREPAPDGLSVRNCWYAQNLSGSELDEFSALIGCRPRQLYGMTETMPAVITQHPLDNDPGVLGEPTLGCQVDLVSLQNDDGDRDPRIREIAVRGVPGHTLFAGYFEDPEATKTAMHSGALRTGDLAYQDEAGRLVFAGRASDRLKVAGENVSPKEIEEALTAHPAVAEAAVVGRPDPIRDEVPVAFVVPDRGAAEVTEADLIAHARDVLAPAKVPRAVTFVAELPRTSVGKIRTSVLRDRAAGNSPPSRRIPGEGRGGLC